MRGFFLASSAIRYIICDYRMWFFLITAILVGLIIHMSVLYIPSTTLLHYIFILGWRRSIAFFVLGESQYSPYSLVAAWQRGFLSLIRVWPLTLVYIIFYGIHFIVFRLLIEVDQSLGILIMANVIIMEIVQFIADFFFIPLVADGHSNLIDIVTITLMYVKRFWLLLARVIVGMFIWSFVVVYAGAIPLFFLNAPTLIFEEYAYCVFFLLITVGQSLLYLQIHYAVQHRD